jgi:hypothetical protein
MYKYTSELRADELGINCFQTPEGFILTFHFHFHINVANFSFEENSKLLVITCNSSNKNQVIK